MPIERMGQLTNGRAASFAAWLSIGDTFSAELLGRAGYDALILDAQHGGTNWDNMGRIIQAVDLTDTPAFVRVPSIDQSGIMRALDLGAAGVIVPMVSNASEARAAAAAMRYPPHGLRSFGMIRNHYAAQTSNFQPLCFVMIETAEAIANLDAIAAIAGVDGLFVGPVDLALSLGMGVLLEMREEVLAQVENVVSVCQRHKKISGCASLNLPYARALLDRGVQFIAQGSDMGFIRRGAAVELEQLRGWREGTARAD
jgi:4-hydroxy-2-oxoheptanedioate aldolase